MPATWVPCPSQSIGSGSGFGAELSAAVAVAGEVVPADDARGREVRVGRLRPVVGPVVGLRAVPAEHGVLVVDAAVDDPDLHAFARVPERLPHLRRHAEEGDARGVGQGMEDEGLHGLHARKGADRIDPGRVDEDRDSVEQPLRPVLDAGADLRGRQLLLDPELSAVELGHAGDGDAQGRLGGPRRPPSASSRRPARLPSRPSTGEGRFCGSRARRTGDARRRASVASEIRFTSSPGPHGPSERNERWPWFHLPGGIPRAGRMDRARLGIKPPQPVTSGP